MSPLPDPRYIAFHAAVAKVAHMAGMAEHLDEINRKYECYPMKQVQKRIS